MVGLRQDKSVGNAKDMIAWSSCCIVFASFFLSKKNSSSGKAREFHGIPRIFFRKDRCRKKKFLLANVTGTLQGTNISHPGKFGNHLPDDLKRHILVFLEGRISTYYVVVSNICFVFNVHP